MSYIIYTIQIVHSFYLALQKRRYSFTLVTTLLHQRIFVSQSFSQERSQSLELRMQHLLTHGTRLRSAHGLIPFAKRIILIWKPFFSSASPYALQPVRQKTIFFSFFKCICSSSLFLHHDSIKRT